MQAESETVQSRKEDLHPQRLQPRLTASIAGVLAGELAVLHVWDLQ